MMGISSSPRFSGQVIPRKGKKISFPGKGMGHRMTWALEHGEELKVMSLLEGKDCGNHT